jgi:hypothetical protein
MDKLPFQAAVADCYAVLSKVDVHKQLISNVETAQNIPTSLCLEERSFGPSLLARLGPRMVIKVDGLYSRLGKGGSVVGADSVEEAYRKIQSLFRDYRKVLVQSYVPGMGSGAFFLRWDGRVIAEFMHRRIHEVPYTGGISSYRESCSDPLIRSDALRKLEQLNWNGVAMMEYRVEPATNRFHFIEMNPRLWGSIHLALYSGVDFPRLLVDSFMGRAPASCNLATRHARCVHLLPLEAQHAWSRFKDASVFGKLGVVARFLAMLADFRIFEDLKFPGDRRLYWFNAGHILSRCVAFGIRRVKKLSRQHRSHADSS